MTLLLILLGCGPGTGTDTDTNTDTDTDIDLDQSNYDACVTWFELACACDNVPKESGWSQEECVQNNVTGTCFIYDMRYCDESHEMFDSKYCGYVQSAASDAHLTWQTCANRLYAECTEFDLILQECGDFPHPKG